MLKNFVIIKHMGNSGKFLFRVPMGISVNAGDKVICDTKVSKDEPGVCCCDSFLADPEIVCPLFGTTPENLKYVTGKIEIERFAEAIDEEKWKDGQKDGAEE